MTQVLELDMPPIYPVETATGVAHRRPTLAYHRVVLLSSHPLFLVGLRTELGRQADFRVVAEVGSPAAALEVVASSPVGLIVVDQTRPGEALLTIKALQRRLNGRVPLVVLGSTESETEIAALRQLGISEYASKIQDGPTLCQVFRQALQGRQPLPGIRATSSSDSWPRRANTGGERPKMMAVAVRSPLSPREMEILQVIAQGCSNKEVAQVLCISNHTLKNHLNNIFKKLDVEDRTQALMLSVRNGWVTL